MVPQGALAGTPLTTGAGGHLCVPTTARGHSPCQFCLHENARGRRALSPFPSSLLPSSPSWGGSSCTCFSTCPVNVFTSPSLQPWPLIPCPWLPVQAGVSTTSTGHHTPHSHHLHRTTRHTHITPHTTLTPHSRCISHHTHTTLTPYLTPHSLHIQHIFHHPSYHTSYHIHTTLHTTLIPYPVHTPDITCCGLPAEIHVLKF